MTTKSEKERSERVLAWLLKRPWLLFVVVLGLWLVIGFGPLLFVGNAAGRGQLGDMFGMANALFSGLALGGVVWAILLQREELALQRKELEETRAELKRSAEAQEASAKLLSEQLNLQRLGLAPVLTFVGKNLNEGNLEVTLTNSGGLVRGLEIDSPALPARIFPSDVLPQGDQARLIFSSIDSFKPDPIEVPAGPGNTVRRPRAAGFTIPFTITCTDALGKQHTLRFRYESALDRVVAEDGATGQS